MNTRYCNDIGFLLDLYRDIDRLCIETEMTSLYDIFFQHHNDAVAITYRKVKLHGIAIPIFNVVLISDKDENAINNGKHVALFHLSKYSDKLYGNIVYKVQIHCVKSVQIRNYFWSVFSRIRTEYGEILHTSLACICCDFRILIFKIF